MCIAFSTPDGARSFDFLVPLVSKASPGVIDALAFCEETLVSHTLLPWILRGAEAKPAVRSLALFVHEMIKTVPPMDLSAKAALLRSQLFEICDILIALSGSIAKRWEHKSALSYMKQGWAKLDVTSLFRL